VADATKRQLFAKQLDRRICVHVPAYSTFFVVLRVADTFPLFHSVDLGFLLNVREFSALSDVAE
jgi:hypothetical protein